MQWDADLEIFLIDPQNEHDNIWNVFWKLLTHHIGGKCQFQFHDLKLEIQ